MSQLSLRKGFAFAAALLLVGTAIAVAVVTHGVTQTSNSARGTNELAKNDEPRALARHMDQAVPVARGEAANEQGEGPDSAAAEHFAANAYPGSDITPAERQTAISAFGKIKAKGVGNGKNSTSAWTSMGPSKAQYPGDPEPPRQPVLRLRPDDRDGHLADLHRRITARCGSARPAAGSGGRTTPCRAARIGSSSPARSDRMLSACSCTRAAGSGPAPARRTPPATPKPVRGSGSPTMAATHGALPNTPDGHGLRDYTATFGYRAISSIVVNGNTMYVGTTRAVRGIASVTGSGVSLYPTTPGVGIWKSTDGGATLRLKLPPGRLTRRRFAASAESRSIPSDVHTVYASAYTTGIFRSTDDGANWTLIKDPLDRKLCGSAGVRGHQAAEREDPHVPGRRASRRTRSAASRVYRTDDAKTATTPTSALRPTRRPVPGPTTTDWPVLVRQLHLHAARTPGHGLCRRGLSVRRAPDCRTTTPGTSERSTEASCFDRMTGAHWTDVTGAACTAGDWRRTACTPTSTFSSTNPNDPDQDLRGLGRRCDAVRAERSPICRPMCRLRRCGSG